MWSLCLAVQGGVCVGVGGWVSMIGTGSRKSKHEKPRRVRMFYR